MAGNNLIEVTDSNFDSVLKESTVPVVVDFWAPWCMPCRMLGPIMENVADKFSEKVKVVKLNVDNNPNVAARFGIQSIPTVKIFKSGEEIHTSMGAMPQQYWDELLEKL